MFNNKKGVALPVAIGISVLIIALLAILIEAQGGLANIIASGGVITSNTPTKQGCTPQLLKYHLSGVATVVQANPLVYTLLLSTVPEIKGLYHVNIQRLAFLSGIDFTIKFSFIDNSNGKVLSTDTESSRLGFVQSNVDVPFNLNFQIPDNNCDNHIDAFNGKIVAELTAKDGFKSSAEHLIVFEDINGVLTWSVG